MTASDAIIPMGNQQGVGPRVKHQPPQLSPLPQGWLTREQTAHVLGISLRTLDLWRAQAFGPPASYLNQRWSRDPITGGREAGKPQGRSVCYWETDIEIFREWMGAPRTGCRVALTLADGRPSDRRIAHRLQRLHLRYDRRLAELRQQREQARRERMEAWARLSAIRSQQAEMDLAIAPHSRAPAYSWQMEQHELQRKARKRARAERAKLEAARRTSEAAQEPLSDMDVWAKL